MSVLAVALPLAFATGASAGTHFLGPNDEYKVVDTITHDLLNNTTTAQYDVTVSDIPQFDSLSHINVSVCHDEDDIDATPGIEYFGDGETEPSSGQAGPLIKFDVPQDVGTESYSYTVPGIWQVVDTTLFGIKQANTLYTTNVHGIGCEPPPPPTGTLIIEKQVEPDGADGAFDFDPSDNVDASNFVLGDGGQKTYTLPVNEEQECVILLGVIGPPECEQPDPYVVEELEEDGFTLTGLTCDDTDDSSADLASRSVSVRLSEGETVTCVFTNTQDEAPPVIQENPPPAQQQQQQQVIPEVIPEQQVLGETARPGSARIAGRTGCVSKAFNVRIAGREIQKVVFSIDGKRVKTVRSAGKKGRYVLRIKPKRFKAGAHNVKARVTFNAQSGTPAKTLRLRFERCVRKAQPQFTG